ncbi:hypothetical protein BH790_gp66 [Gordonia phage Gsput1]|uniref:Uncharacterized protein n=1 Tax=Gordonia phage Gsput1 TaxID=1622193 RepID=A0A0E3T6A7_9CAUD|nr:hypothetical protein BH790_gp66 [Gordonia phage Gsput1]AKC03091.1 hypothetical protein Gsput1_66 [Gordonia phage Gsput1]
MRNFSFEDWNGYVLLVDHDGRGVIDWYSSDADGAVNVEMPTSAIPNLIAWLYGQLDDESRAKVRDGLTRPELSGIRGIADRVLARIGRRLVQVNAGKVLA